MQNRPNKLAVTNPVLGNLNQYLARGGEGGEGFFARLIIVFVSGLVVIGGLAFFFYLIYGAIQWITSGGDKNKLENAQIHIRNAIIGIAILLSVIAITRLVENVFGITILYIDLSQLRIV